MSTRQHTITALVKNETGTLNRLVSLFRRRGFSLASLNAGDCERPGYSRLTLVVSGDDETMRQCVSQIMKVIDVVEAADLSIEESVRRELALIKTQAAGPQRSEVAELVRLFGGRVAYVSQDQLTAEIADEPSTIDRLLGLLEPYGIQEVVRTGLVAIPTTARERTHG